MLSALLQDVRQAARTCLRSPLVSGLAVVAFALGIGATTTVYTVFHGVLLAPLPFADPDRVVAVYDTQPNCPRCPASFPKYEDWKARGRVLARIGGTTEASFVLTGGAEPRRVQAARGTASLIDVFGVPPLLGRWFNEVEDAPGAPKVAVLTHGLWSTYFARDPRIVGRTVSLDGDAYEVVGVLRPEFKLYDQDPFQPVLFVPFGSWQYPTSRNSHFMMVYGRLQPGVSVEGAAAEMRALGQELAAVAGHDHGIDLRSYREAVVGPVRPQLRLLLGAVAVVLVIGCANVANLLLAAGVARRRELSVRLALGARFGNLARQLVAEATLLALTGGAAGLLLSLWLLRGFLQLAGAYLPRVDSIAVDASVLTVATLITLGVGVLSGLWPLLRLRIGELAAVMREDDTRTGSGSSQIGSGLVVAEVALAFALLVAGGVLAKNLVLLEGRDIGMRVEGTLTFTLEPGGARYAEPAATRAFYRETLTRLAALPGVQHVGSTSHLPMEQFGWNGPMRIEGPVPWDARDAPLVQYRWFAGEYFQALDVPLLQGRWLDARDGADTATVLINRAMAEKFWPGQSPLGRRFGSEDDRRQWFEVVGVVGDVRAYGIAAAVPFEFYRQLEQSVFNRQAVVIRVADGDPAALGPAIRSVIRSIDPNLPVPAVREMQSVVSASVGRQRLVSTTAVGFALLAAVLAMVGVFGVMTHGVRRQRRELGIRLALGADGRSLRRLVVGRGLRLALLGIAVGAVAAWQLDGVLASMVDDVRPGDAQVLAAAVAVVLLASIAAAWGPARAAERTDPLVVLRDR